MCENTGIRDGRIGLLKKQNWFRLFYSIICSYKICSMQRNMTRHNKTCFLVPFCFILYIILVPFSITINNAGHIKCSQHISRNLQTFYLTKQIHNSSVFSLRESFLHYTIIIVMPNLIITQRSNMSLKNILSYQQFHFFFLHFMKFYFCISYFQTT